MRTQKYININNHILIISSFFKNHLKIHSKNIFCVFKSLIHFIIVSIGRKKTNQRSVWTESTGGQESRRRPKLDWITWWSGAYSRTRWWEWRLGQTWGRSSNTWAKAWLRRREKFKFCGFNSLSPDPERYQNCESCIEPDHSQDWI